MTFPLVSIAMPVYNGEKWLEQAIGTLIKQSYENVEIIIADDCSTDGSSKICERFAAKNPQITFIKNQTNLGAQGNFRKLLHLCSGKYITHACQDDYWDENFVSSLVEKLESNSDAVLAGSAVQMLDKKDMIYKERHYNGKWNPEKLNTYRLLCSLMLPVKKGKWIKNNLFYHGLIRTEDLKYCYTIFPGIVEHDRHFLLLLALTGKWCYVDRVLYFRRVGVGGIQLKAMSNDPVYRRKKNIFHPIISVFQMFSGVIRHRNAKISKKLFSIPVIIGHVVFEILRPLKITDVKTLRLLKPKNIVILLKDYAKKIFS